jgi:hypothetical protein
MDQAVLHLLAREREFPASRIALLGVQGEKNAIRRQGGCLSP